MKNRDEISMPSGKHNKKHVKTVHKNILNTSFNYQTLPR